MPQRAHNIRLPSDPYSTCSPECEDKQFEDIRAKMIAAAAQPVRLELTPLDPEYYFENEI